jgi:two-component system LytT family response regulator
MTIIIIDPGGTNAARYLQAAFPSVQIVANCTNGAEGWDAVSDFQPDAVFLNLDLPDTAGLDLMHRLSALPPALIVCSEWTTYAYEALQAGVRGYLLLPLEEAEVKKVLQRIIR